MVSQLNGISSSMSDFENTVAERAGEVLAEQATEEQQKRIAAEVYAKVGAAKTLMLERADNNAGTPLAEVLNEDEVLLCGQFLTYMAGRGFPGATPMKRITFTHNTVYDRKLFGGKKYRGTQSVVHETFSVDTYKIGMLDTTYAGRVKGGTKLALLCADGVLRASNGIRWVDRTQYYDITEWPIRNDLRRFTDLTDHTRADLFPPQIGKIASKHAGGMAGCGDSGLSGDFWDEFTPVPLGELLIDIAAASIAIPEAK